MEIIAVIGWLIIMSYVVNDVLKRYHIPVEQSYIYWIPLLFVVVALIIVSL